MQYVRPMALNSHKWVRQETNMIQNIPTPSVLIALLQSAIATFQHLPRQSIFVCFREQNYGIEDNSLEIDGNWNAEFPFWKASIIHILSYFLPSVRRGLLDRCCCSRFASGTDAECLGGVQNQGRRLPVLAKAQQFLQCRWCFMGRHKEAGIRCGSRFPHRLLPHN